MVLDTNSLRMGIKRGEGTNQATALFLGFVGDSVRHRQCAGSVSGRHGVVMLSDRVKVSRDGRGGVGWNSKIAFLKEGQDAQEG